MDRSGDRDLIDRYKEKVYALLNYLKHQENSDGLMENLKGWVFVEWSKANELTQDVNYPSNMLYSVTLKTAEKLYEDDALLKNQKKLSRKCCASLIMGNFHRQCRKKRWNKSYFTIGQ